MIIHKTGIFRISCLSAVLVLVSCGDTEHKVRIDKEITEMQKLYREAAGEYVWEGMVMASEYDEYNASVTLVLDSNGYFRWDDNFPTGPEADEFNLVLGLQYPVDNEFSDEFIDRYPGEFIEHNGRYTITKDGRIELFFFTIRESYAKIKAIKSTDERVDMTVNVHAMEDSLEMLTGKGIDIEYSYNRLPYNYTIDAQHPDKKNTDTSNSGTFRITLPKDQHVHSLWISCNDYLSVYVDGFDTLGGYDYELNAYVSKLSTANHHRYKREIKGALAIKTGAKELTVMPAVSSGTFF